MKFYKVFIIVILSIIFACGCSSTYTLKINNDFSLEDNLIVESSDTKNRDERLENINTYKKIYIQAFDYKGNLENYYNDSDYGVKFNNVYNTIDDYNNSEICKSFNCKINNEEFDKYNIMIINLDYDSFVFKDCGEGDLNGPKYVYFEIEFPFDVIETNSKEKISDNKYRWVINEKDLKEIRIKYTTDEIKQKNKEAEKKDMLKTALIVLGYVVIIIAIIFIRKNNKK